MNSVSGNMTWTLSQVAAVLSSSRVAQGTTVLALCPTIQASLSRFLDSARCRMVAASPAFLVEYIFGEQFPEIMLCDSGGGLSTFRGPFADVRDQELYLVPRPLTALSISGGHGKRVIETRTIDSLFSGLKYCSALFIQDSELINGATDLINRDKPLLILRDNSCLRNSPIGHLGYFPIEYSFSDRVSGGYTIFSTDPHDLAMNLSADRCVPNTGFALPPLVSNAFWQRGSKALVWTNRAPGLIFLSEQPAESSKLRIKLFSSSPHGLNIFVAGVKVKSRLVYEDENKYQILDIINLPKFDQDRLVDIILSPIRLSTTDPVERLEFQGLEFI